MSTERTARPKARVFVVSQPSLFEDGIEELLRQEQGLEIVGREEDPQQAVRRIRESHPDVILVADGEATTGLGGELIRLVREGFRIRVVEVHLASNTLCLYCGERQPIREVRDLVDTLEHICHGLSREAQVPLSPAMGQPAA